MPNSAIFIKLAILALVILAVVFFRNYKSKVEPVENIVQKPANDAGLALAKVQAQNEIDYFINFLYEHSKDEKYGFSIKTKFTDDLGNVENMWVDTKKYDNGVFSGTLGNDPVLVTSIKFGDPVTVRKEDVQDWILHDGYLKAIVGGFSLKEFKK